MTKLTYPETYISVIVAPEGHAIIFQGFYKQALFLTREQVPRFLADPSQAAMLVIPPFAATGLECYTATGHIESIKINRDLALSPEFNFTVKIRQGDTIAYYSDPTEVAGPTALANQGVTLVITPRAVATVHASKPKASIAIVACIPQAESPNYPGRFASDPLILREALQNAFYQTQHMLRYDN